MKKIAGIKRGKVKKRTPCRPESSVPNFGFSQILKRIHNAIELIDRRRG